MDAQVCVVEIFVEYDLTDCSAVASSGSGFSSWNEMVVLNLTCGVKPVGTLEWSKSLILLYIFSRLFWIHWVVC